MFKGTKNLHEKGFDKPQMARAIILKPADSD